MCSDFDVYVHRMKDIYYLQFSASCVYISRIRGVIKSDDLKGAPAFAVFAIFL